VSKTSLYTQAGVNIDQKMAALASIKRMVRRTATRGTLSGIGLFGGMFAAPGKGKVLVASTDGVGTKLKVAAMAGRHNTVGQDLVNHCVNDILVHGAKPLFFLDYVGVSNFQPAVFREVVEGLCAACRRNRCALLGGETAEMPGLYPAGEYDLVGTIVGVANREQLVTGASVRPGDMIIGLPSSGLHTNGYSLARKVVFEKMGLGIRDRFPGTHRSVADVLLAVHRSYAAPVRKLMRKVTVRGMAHITGGGFYDNIPRVLPETCTAVIDRNAWTVPNLFRVLQEQGQVDDEEMYRVFNMGVGYVIIVRERDSEQAMSSLREAKAAPLLIGYIREGPRKAVISG
jgi:phosphoribosylformylglycinamidine cyclo-ligase